MKGWKKVVVMNASFLVGIFISLFLVPSQIPIWLWAAVAIAVLALFNYLFFLRKRNGRMAAS
jgi:hypothetical protein